MIKAYAQADMIFANNTIIIIEISECFRCAYGNPVVRQSAIEVTQIRAKRDEVKLLKRRDVMTYSYLREYL